MKVSSSLWTDFFFSFEVTFWYSTCIRFLKISSYRKIMEFSFIAWPPLVTLCHDLALLNIFTFPCNVDNFSFQTFQDTTFMIVHTGFSFT